MATFNTVDSPREGLSIQEALENMATASPEKFCLYFRRMRKMFPNETAEACLCYIAANGLDPAGRNIAARLVLDGGYAKTLVDPDALTLEVASSASVALRTFDTKFMVRFLQAAEELTAPPAILRSLGLVPSFGDYSLLLSWLRILSQHKHPRVRSRAVKLLCGLRPSQTVVERQMTSGDPRIRANAIEGLWQSGIPEATGLFKSAASDKHHRVVGNALVGLYLQGNEKAFDRMIELTEHPEFLFRATMAWCFGRILDDRAVPTLRILAKDASVVVRRRARKSLALLQVEEELPVPEAALPEELAEVVPEPIAEILEEPTAQPLPEPVVETIPEPAPVAVEPPPPPPPPPVAPKPPEERQIPMRPMFQSLR